jgi:hypothetical protein
MDRRQFALSALATAAASSVVAQENLPKYTVGVIGHTGRGD